MASLKAIRKRIATVKSTQKITRAMKTVAGARLARAQARIVALRPYAVKTHEMLSTVVAGFVHPDHSAGSDAIAADPDHPYLAERPERNIALIVITSDRGQCGSFNANIGKAAERAWRERAKEGQDVTIYTIGRKGREYLTRRGAHVSHDFLGIWDGLDISKAQTVVRTVIPPFLEKKYDAIYLVYNEFKSAMTQRVVVEPLLPVRHTHNDEALVAAGSPHETANTVTDFLFEPTKKGVLEKLVPMYVDVMVYRALLESLASEFGARMTAMDSATKNAKEVIDRLSLAYNRARQAAITKELMEIIGGAEALKG